MINKEELRGLSRSFFYAFRGIAYCIKNERNMRIHISMMMIVSYFSFFFKLTSIEYLILFLCFGMVLAAETFNTAIEALVNLESPSYHHYARIAKDVAAGAVAITAFVAAVAGLILFFKPLKLANTLLLFIAKPFWGILFLLLIIAAFIFIFRGANIFKEKNIKIYHMRK